MGALARLGYANGTASCHVIDMAPWDGHENPREGDVLGALAEGIVGAEGLVGTLGQTAFRGEAGTGVVTSGIVRVGRTSGECLQCQANQVRPPAKLCAWKAACGAVRPPLASAGGDKGDMNQ